MLVSYKKQNCDHLGPHVHEKCNEAVSQNANTYFVGNQY
jgi:hypothetical protein